MAYTNMSNDVYIASIPAVTNENDRAIQQDRIVDAGKLQGLTTGNSSGNIPINNGTLNVNCNVEKLGGNLASAFATAGHTHAVVTTSSNGLMSNTDKAKLDTIATSAEVNQMAFSNILVGSTTIQADSKTDTLELVAGANILLTPDATNDKVTIAITGKVANATLADTATTCTGNSATTTKLATARTINGVSFDGAANITIADSTKLPLTGGTLTGALSGTTISATTFVGALSGNATTAGTCSGNSTTATKLATARTIAGVSFDGSANIAIPYSGLTGVPASVVASGRQLFTSSGTFTVPTGVTKVYITACGGGGGGASGTGSVGGGGGASGIFSIIPEEVTVAAGESIVITVGSGGSGGTAKSGGGAGNTGVAGGSSSFGSYLSVSGGGGGGIGGSQLFSPGGTNEYSTNNNGGNGSDSRGDTNYYPTAGSGIWGGKSGAANFYAGAGGGGLLTPFLISKSKGGDGGNTGAIGGNATGFGTGGGGGGGGTNPTGAGGKGASGFVLVEW